MVYNVLGLLEPRSIVLEMAEGNSSSEIAPILNLGDYLPSTKVTELESGNSVSLTDIAAKEESKNTLYVFIRHTL